MHALQLPAFEPLSLSFFFRGITKLHDGRPQSKLGGRTREDLLLTQIALSIDLEIYIFDRSAGIEVLPVMPPFSGKKKKEQLQQKRQKKREKEEQQLHQAKEEQQLRESRLLRGELVTDEIISELMRAKRAEKRNANRSAAPGATGDGRSTSASSGEEEEGQGNPAARSKVAPAPLMQYGADRSHGCRSVFEKETQDVIDTRKKRSVEPLPYRTTMPATGIPFGDWFMFPSPPSGSSSSSMAQAGKKSRRGQQPAMRSTTATASEEGAEIELREEDNAVASLRPLVSTDLFGSGSSTAFPIAVELPSRGWTRAEDGRIISAVGNPKESVNDEAAVRGQRGGSSSAPPTTSADAVSIKQIEISRFEAYVALLQEAKLPAALRGLELNAYERNIEVWQQLWRTVELSDVVVIVADARYPILHAHLGLLTYITKEQQKPCILLLNKEDLVPMSTLRLWKKFLGHYLRSLAFDVMEEEEEEKQEELSNHAAAATAGAEASTKSKGGVAPILLRSFTANPRQETAGQADSDVDVTHRQRRRRHQAGSKLYEKLKTGKLKMKPGVRRSNEDGEDDFDDYNGVGELYYADVENFKGRKAAELSLQHEERAFKELEVVAAKVAELLQQCKRLAGARSPTEHHQHYVGFVGFPNVGKSSLLNCIRGTKVVSVSSTPGHTKHIQTIPLPEEAVVLVDSPGLVLPVYGVPRPLQAVLGTHQIAQARDPQSSIAYLAAYLPLERLYGLQRPDDAIEEEEWSAFEICEAYARKRGYFVKHGKGALDLHRAAIALLQESYEGRVTLFYRPPELNLLQSAVFKTVMKPLLLLSVFGNKANGTTEDASIVAAAKGEEREEQA